jgi:hypothetical protein
MTGFQTNREMIFSGSDLSRPRMVVEKEKLNQLFPGFEFYGSNGQVTSVMGWLNTSYGNRYLVRVVLDASYPYSLPRVELPVTTLEAGTPHRYGGGSICIMRSDQWSTTLSLAFVVAKAAIWLNKYDSWVRNGKGRWPGKGQSHG